MLPALVPGIIRSYDGPRRLFRVEIPGLTDGSAELPEATVMPPPGDRSVGDHATEQRFLVGDTVHLMFECGDPRFPVIVGHRTPREGNATGWRRWRHANIEMTADGIMRLNAEVLQVNARVEIVGDGVTHNGTDIGDSHEHPGVTRGPNNTDPPA